MMAGVTINSLVLMHTLNEKRRELGVPLSVAEVADVAYLRFRPIFITSVTTAAGLLPTAYGFMGENSYITPMVMSMVWGVMFGGVVSLVLLPALYMVEQDVRALLARPA